MSEAPLPMNGRPELTCEVVNVTPDLAGEWLTLNQHNRPLSDARIRRYAAEMTSGQWMLTHQAIAFDTWGQLLDGQNRLQAVIRANMTIPFLVVRGAPRESFYVVDTGKRRNLADALAIMGEQNSRILGSTINLVWRLTNRDADEFPARRNPSTLEAVTRFEEDGKVGFRHAVPAGSRVYYRLRGPHSAYCGCYYLLSQIEQDDADSFYEMFATGANLPADDPALRLRNTILNLRGDNGLRVDNQYVAALTIKAWNAYRQGKAVKNLSWRRSGPQAEKYPTPV